MPMRSITMSNPLNCLSASATPRDNRYPFKTIVFSDWFDTNQQVERLLDLMYPIICEEYPGVDFVPQLDMVVEHDFGGLREVTFYARERHE